MQETKKWVFFSEHSVNCYRRWPPLIELLFSRRTELCLPLTYLSTLCLLVICFICLWGHLAGGGIMFSICPSISPSVHSFICY